jgi:hypothetical protein
MDTRPKGKARIYACGGAGLNIGHLFEKNRGASEPAFAELDIVYVDTSKSNYRQQINEDHCYMLDHLDGSGKIRKENHDEISTHIRAILKEFKPVDLNIVLHSAAGGSGSVFGPLLVGEMIESDVPTIVVAIGSTDTRIDAENTLKTIKSYESIARKHKTPIVMSYIQNSETTSRSAADDHVVGTIMNLCVLFSRENRELDSRDLFNWLRFDRVTTFPVQLAALTIINCKDDKDFDMSELGNVITVATLAKEGVNTALRQMPEYQCVGYIQENADDVVRSVIPMHFVTSDGVFTEVVSHLEKILKEVGESQAARIKKGTILNASDTPTDSGLVL